MNAPVNFAAYDVGYDIPAKPGMNEADIQTPCLILDLDALGSVEIHRELMTAAVA